MVGDFQYYVLCVGERGGGGESAFIFFCVCARERGRDIFYADVHV